MGPRGLREARGQHAHQQARVEEFEPPILVEVPLCTHRFGLTPLLLCVFQILVSSLHLGLTLVPRFGAGSAHLAEQPASPERGGLGGQVLAQGLVHVGRGGTRPTMLPNLAGDTLR